DFLSPMLTSFSRGWLGDRAAAPLVGLLWFRGLHRSGATFKHVAPFQSQHDRDHQKDIEGRIYFQPASEQESSQVDRARPAVLPEQEARHEEAAEDKEQIDR